MKYDEYNILEDETDKKEVQRLINSKYKNSDKKTENILRFLKNI